MSDRDDLNEIRIYYRMGLSDSMILRATSDPDVAEALRRSYTYQAAAFGVAAGDLIDTVAAALAVPFGRVRALFLRRR